jgi:Cof subfamily protein (haloacid dehalogenase superfamily)
MVLFVSDLDGTLLNDDTGLEPASLDKLNNMIAAGLHFTVATARAYPSIRAILHGLDLRLPVIEQNGAIVRDFSTGHVIKASVMSPEDALQVCRIFNIHDAHPLISVLDDDENIVFHGKIEGSDMEWAISTASDEKSSRRMVAYKHCTMALTLPVLLFRYLGCEAQIKAIAHDLLASLPNISVAFFHNFYTEGWEINISSIEAQKGRALKSLRAYGVEGKKIVVFGDSHNDLDMFDYADEAYAVANATVELKQKATGVIGSNMENAVVNYIEKHALALLPNPSLE